MVYNGTQSSRVNSEDREESNLAVPVSGTQRLTAGGSVLASCILVLSWVPEIPTPGLPPQIHAA